MIEFISNKNVSIILYPLFLTSKFQMILYFNLHVCYTLLQYLKVIDLKTFSLINLITFVTSYIRLINYNLNILYNSTVRVYVTEHLNGWTDLNEFFVCVCVTPCMAEWFKFTIGHGRP